MDGVYLPYWTFDSQTTTQYIGQRGEYYYDTETYTETGDLVFARPGLRAPGRGRG